MDTNPQSIRSAVFSGARRIHIEQRPVPAREAAQALIRVEYVAICGSDLARFWQTDEAIQQPVVMGHEFSGRVIAAPTGCGLTPGQAVTAAPLYNCGECELCRAGKENLCRSRQQFGIAIDGALQEVVSLPAGRVYPLPVNISLEAGTLIEPLAVAYHTVRRSGVPNGNSALVLGAGAIGLFIAQVWRALGYGEAVVVDIDPRRLAVAEGLGIPVWAKEPAQSSFPVVFEATGSARAFAHWLPALAPRGRAIVVSKLEGAVAIDWLALLRKEGQITTSRFFTLADFQRSIEFVQKGAVQLQPLIGQIVPLHRLAENEGAAVMSSARDHVRLVVRVQA